MALRIEYVLLCDQVIQDADTQKPTLVSVFDVIGAFSFPATHPRLSLFAKVLAPRGEKLRVTLRFVPPDGPPVVHPAGEQVFENPTGVVSVISNLRDLPLRTPGEYKFQVVINGDVLGEASLTAVQLSREQRGE